MQQLHGLKQILKTFQKGKKANSTSWQDGFQTDASQSIFYYMKINCKEPKYQTEF